MKINSIINCMDNKPSEQIHKNKMLLNKEFEDKANIKGLVSYIYYPSQRRDVQGHSELEIEGNSYILTNATKTRGIRPLSRMIQWTQTGFGLPFFRFNISVTPHQLYEIREGVSTTNSMVCSIGVAKALEQYANFKIPLPLAMSPLASAIYLATAKKLGSQRIYQIESYGKPLEHLAKIIPGVAGESIGAFIGLACVIQSGYYMYNFDADTYAGFLSKKTMEFLYN